MIHIFMEVFYYINLVNTVELVTASEYKKSRNESAKELKELRESIRNELEELRENHKKVLENVRKELKALHKKIDESETQNRNEITSFINSWS
jgi:hypothetical protein